MTSHDHNHEHEHSEAAAPDPEPRARALQSLLVEKGLLSTDAVDAAITAYETEVGPMNGARVVARAWTEPAFKERLLADANAAIADFEFAAGAQHLEVVENTPATHNVVVCTLCSCYPWSLLGLPPTWYKTPAYRSRMVREPRAVLAEFGLEIPSEREVAVWDSSSEIRYMVLPQRPAGTNGMSEAALADLVTRNAMIGVARVPSPASDDEARRGERAVDD